MNYSTTTRNADFTIRGIEDNFCPEHADRRFRLRFASQKHSQTLKKQSILPI